MNRDGDGLHADQPATGARAAKTVLVVDDHLTFAEMLSAALDAVPELRCVGTALSAAEAVAAARRLHPDIVVMDIQMPHEDGLVATQRIREAVPGAMVAVVTAHTSPEWVGRAARAGASAFIPKNGSLVDMIAVVTSIQPGQMVVAPSTFSVPPEAAPRPPAGPDLSGRELEVLRLLAAGMPVKLMAPKLGITVNTCRGYVKSVRQKLKVASQLEAVLRARQLGLIDDSDPGSVRP